MNKRDKEFRFQIQTLKSGNTHIKIVIVRVKLIRERNWNSGKMAQ